MNFEAYMRGFRISADDARSLREAQSRARETFKLQTGPYAGLEQNVKARVLVAKNLKPTMKIEITQKKTPMFEVSLDLKRLVKTGAASVPDESLEFDDELPSVDIYYPKKETIPAVPAPLDFTPPKAKRSNSAAVLSTKLDQRIQRLLLSKRNRTRLRGGELIPMDGGKDRDVILFNEVSAENACGDVAQNETELSLY
ncbi:hypothetical protein PsorP6_003278 [Peronosclerospora sorghi]|uniref:Uncharacterized protein n=1 Tax=Peronosclerospora sorghi TaxID=230839 RepID=A0ACC0VMF5_9STRA|nr:hypothetical protein PsorP6_003278 [Peronosclerospora sorghi]